MQERDPGSIPGSGRSPGEGTGYPPQYSWASLVAQTVKHLPPVQEAAQRPGFSPWVGKIPLRRAWQPTPVFLPRESPWTEEPGGLQSVGSQRVGHNWVTTHTHTHTHTHTPTSHRLWNFIIIYFWWHWVFVAVCRLSLVAASRGYPPVVVHRLLTAMASLVAKHEL